MRATVRITWLLLSLSLLFHSICSSDVDDGATSVSKNAAAATPATTAVPANGTTPGTIITEATTVNKTGAPAIDDAGETNKPTQAPTPKQTTAVVTATTPPKSTFKPVPDQPQAPTVTDNPVPPPTTVSVATGVTPTVKDDASPAAATSSLPNIITQASTADSSGSLVTSPKVTIIGTSEASLTSKTSGTGPPISLPENTNNEGTTKIPEISTDGPTAGQQATTLTTITSKTSPEASKGVEGTEKVTVTVTVTSQEQTASRAPEPTGTTGTASTPSILTKAGPPAAETLGTQAGTTPRQTTPTPDLTTTTTTTITTLTAAQSKTFLYSLNTGHEREEEKDLVEVCRRLMANLQDGNCSLTWRHRNGKIQFDCVEINGKVTTSLATQYYEEITMKPTDNKTLIAILASCGALLIMIVILAVCASHHRKPYSETQQHLTEELHTVENGYHDNPTLEVMEVQPEMQEKKMALNGEFNDSWMIPIDNLLKEDIPDEEDTHL